MLRYGFLMALCFLSSASSYSDATQSPRAVPETKVAIYLSDVDEVDSATQSFSASIFYLAEWHDSSLVGKRSKDFFTDLSEVWNPGIGFMNQRQVSENYQKAVLVSPDGDVRYRQKIWGKFSQTLDLHDFPLDHQTLTIEMTNPGMASLKPFGVSEGKQSGVADHLSVSDFKIVSWEAEPMTYTPSKGIPEVHGYELRVHVIRELTYYILKVILPLCLIIIVSWLPRWIDPKKYFIANIGISTTAFLTLVAYILSINVILPRMSYITRMDRFVLMSVVVVFASVIHTVASGTLSEKEPELVLRGENRSRIVYPVIMVFMFVIAFVL